MSQRERVKRAYLAKQGQRPQQQPQPAPKPDLDYILWLAEERHARQLRLQRKPQQTIKKALDILNKTEI